MLSRSGRTGCALTATLLLCCSQARAIVAGRADGEPPDSPEQRVDPNTPDSIFAGVAALEFADGLVCTATPISRRHLLTAANCMLRFNGSTVTFAPAFNVVFNADGARSHVIEPAGVESIKIHPGYNPYSPPLSVRPDDLAMITLREGFDLPESIPVYPVLDGEAEMLVEFEIAGYGASGYAGDNTSLVPASPVVKRRGANRLEFYLSEPDPDYFRTWGSVLHPPETAGSLGNDIEAGWQPGDGGAPALIEIAPGERRVFGIVTDWRLLGFYVVPSYGSEGYGPLLSAYRGWLDAVTTGVPGEFSLINPACGVHDQPTNQFLSWERAYEATSYTVTLARDPALLDIVAERTGPLTFAVFFSGEIEACETYHWRVVAHGPGGSRVGEPGVCSFTTVSPRSDLNSDGVVNTSDLASMMFLFGTNEPTGDINGDGWVDTADLGLLIRDFGLSCLD